MTNKLWKMEMRRTQKRAQGTTVRKKERKKTIVRRCQSEHTWGNGSGGEQRSSHTESKWNVLRETNGHRKKKTNDTS